MNFCSSKVSYSILCKYFVFFGIRFDLEYSWPIRLIGIICSCTFNLFKANRLLALYLSIEKTNYPLRIVQILQLFFDVWLYFYLLFNQDSIADQLDFVIGRNLVKEIRTKFMQKLKFYRFVYLIFVIDLIRLSVLWFLTGSDEIYHTEFPYLNQSTIDNLIGYKHILIKLLVFIALFNKLLNTMLLTISIFLYLFIYYAQHLQCFILSQQTEQCSNLIEFKSKYRIFQRQSVKTNNIFGILPFIWLVYGNLLRK